MTPKLAILIPTLNGRELLLDRLMKQLLRQIENTFAKEVVIFTNTDNKEETTGAKRNQLVALAAKYNIPYVCFFDDDDLPGQTYIQRQLEVAKSGKDCGELWGNIYFSGKRGKPFHHSIIYPVWSENKYQYNRCPNHLNAVKTEIMIQFPFPDQVFGEDGQQSEAMAKADILKTMHPIEDVIYHYFTGIKDTDQEKEYIKQLIL